MTYVIDRFDDGWAVLEREDGLTFHVPSRWLPDEASEGDVLDVAVEVEAYWSGLRFVVDLEATRRRREEANALRARLPKGPEGDLDL